MSELQQTPAAPAEDRPDWVVDTVLDGQSIRTVTPKLLSPLIKVGYPVLGIICLAVALFLALFGGQVHPVCRGVPGLGPRRLSPAVAAPPGGWWSSSSGCSGRATGATASPA